MPLTVVNIRTASPANGEIIYCGRGGGTRTPSPLGNPFAITPTANRTQVIAMYKRWLWTQIQNMRSPASLELARIRNLHTNGHVIQLACHCAPQACHCDVIKAAVEWMTMGNE